MLQSNTPNKSDGSIHILDAAKFICALLVIVIHTAPLESYSEIANFYTRDVLARVAVPLFFAISGFLFSRRQNLYRTLKRTIWLYLGWSAFYLTIQIPQWYTTGWWGLHIVKDYVVALITKGSYYHLWYLLAMIYALLLLAWLLRLDSVHLLKIACAVLWTAECLTYSYSWIGIDQIASLCFLLDRFSGVADGVFRALPLMLIGVFAGKNAFAQEKSHWMRWTLVSFILMMVEASWLYFRTPNSGLYSYLFSTPIFTYCALCLLLRCEFHFRKSSSARILRHASLLIYCIHPFIDYFIALLPFGAGIIRWLLVTMISAAISIAYSRITYNTTVTKFSR